MILKALADYTDRKNAITENEDAVYGYDYKLITHVVVLNNKGDFLRLEDLCEVQGKKKVGKKFLLPKEVNRSRNVISNICWENNLKYIFGNEYSENEKDDFSKYQNEFKSELKLLDPNNNFINAVINYLDHKPLEKIKIHDEQNFDQFLKDVKGIIFKIEDFYLHDILKVQISKKLENTGTQDVKINCLISGKLNNLSRLLSNFLQSVPVDFLHCVPPDFLQAVPVNFLQSIPPDFLGLCTT